MAEYVERGKAIEACFDGYADCREDCAENIRKLRAADVAPVRHGHWYWDKDGRDWGLGAWKCSKCHRKPETWWEADNRINPYRCSGSHFCGNCGAKMDGEEEP